jgi:hypothetical protein
MSPHVMPFSEEENAKAYDQAVAADFKKVERINGKLGRLAELLSSVPSLWGGVASLGCTQMFQASDFPVFSEKVLDGGFSPPDWFLTVGKASAQLGLSIAEKMWHNCKDSERKIEELLEIVEERPNIISQDEIERVEKVLRWEEVSNRLDEIAVKVLAFCWIADRLMILSSISCSEAEVKVQKEVWRLLEELFVKDRQTLVTTVDKMISKMREIEEKVGSRKVELADWADIFRLPW